MQKAIEAGGTNNAIVGRALVKRGIFVESRDGNGFAYSAPIPESSRIPPENFFASQEERTEDEAVKYADTMRGDEEAVPAKPESFRVEFDRIGRHQNPAPLHIEGHVNLEAAETEIYRYATKFLSSREFEVIADLEAGTVFLDNGRFGSGRIVRE